MPFRKSLSAALLSFLFCLIAGAQEADSLLSALVVSDVNGSMLTNELRGITTLDVRLIGRMPKLLGNTDPIQYATHLPGVQTSGEMDAGLHVYGCENAHNLMLMGCVPVYGTAHMLGMFSVFNSGHFRSMTLEKTAVTASAPNRLGASLQMRLPQDVSRVQRTSGEASLGPISSQATLELPLGKKFGIMASVRAAYPSLLYGSMLHFNEYHDIDYGFHDGNFTAFWNPSPKDRIRFNFYANNDHMGLSEDKFGTRDMLKWGNLLGSLEWDRNWNGVYLEQRLYGTTYYNNIKTGMSWADINGEGSILDFGYGARLLAGTFECGLELISRRMTPLEFSAIGSNPAAEGRDIHRSGEFSMYAGRPFSITHRLTCNVGLRGSLYIGHNGETYANPDPNVSLLYKSGKWGSVQLSYARRHQYLFQTGFSNIGLPTEYWIDVHGDFKPQSTHNFDLLWDTDLPHGLQLEAGLYYKRLYNQIEYCGTLLDMVLYGAKFDESTIVGEGRNYGITAMLSRQKSKVTGWVSASLGRAMRHYAGLGDRWWPAQHERIFEMNAVASYQLSERWNFGASMVVASGIPFTAARYFYVVNDMLLTEYGERNANRVRPYIRLDVSVNYDFPSKGRTKSSINFSIHNLTFNKNEFYYIMKRKDDEFGYLPSYIYVRLMPSINYYIKF